MLQREELPHPVREHYFAKPRMWRFDYAWPDHKVALEVEGGVWIQGRHSRGSGFIKDIEKYNAAATLGWLVLRTIPQNLCAPETIDAIRKAIALRKVA